ncbi:MAG: hypothetical protein H0V82_00240 [Candidatus Protochlamydia sp.]|nr:hypothetical protein [Candidatus Protochlamydia sp.]
MLSHPRFCRVFFFFSVLFLFVLDPIYAAPKHKHHNEDELKHYLLPSTHPLKNYLKVIFKNPHMFKTIEHFENEGFKVIRGHRNLMVGAYPSIEQFLYKKFPDGMPQNKQLDNFVKRIRGAEVIRSYIKKYGFKHMVVPKKWLYRLPHSFPSDNGTPSYLLIVENMDIYGDWKDPNGVARQLYYNMDIEVLTELCTLLHAIGGCDAFPRNQPFTRSGKIAFVDTEHVGQMKGHFLKHIVPALNEELQAYAVALWMKLEAEQAAKKK